MRPAWPKSLVRDTGCGIPADKLREIFEPFYTTKQADQQGQGGTGLGLALCREIIEAHKGRIRVESVMGKGTTFTLKLALAPAPVVPAGTPPCRRRWPRQRRTYPDSPKSRFKRA